MASESQSIGRAKTVLVFGQGSGQKAVISAILARLAEPAAGERVRFAGPVEFSPSVQKHVRDTVVPIVDHIPAELNVPVRHYEISAVNLGVASAPDVGTKISGLSADVPVFLAMLSAGLGLPVPDDLVSTGHIASIAGDITAVKALPAKVQAAVDDRSLGRFLYPDLERGKSLGVLSPQERQRHQDAVMAARDSIGVRPLEPYPAGQPAETLADPECVAFDAIAARIDERALVRKYGIPIDSARGGYVLASSTVGSYEEFIDTLAAFYIHLQRHLHPEVLESPDMVTARTKATALLEKTFYGEAASKAAFVRATDGTDGGMRLVLDLFTEQFKRQEQAEYVQQVFKDALEPMDWNQRVAFMRGAMKRLGPFLPADVRYEPPERFARRPEVIVQVFVESLDRINRIVSTL